MVDKVPISRLLLDSTHKVERIGRASRHVPGRCPLAMGTCRLRLLLDRLRHPRPTRRRHPYPYRERSWTRPDTVPEPARRPGGSRLCPHQNRMCHIGQARRKRTYHGETRRTEGRGPPTRRRHDGLRRDARQAVARGEVRAAPGRYDLWEQAEPPAGDSGDHLLRRPQRSQAPGWRR